MTLFKRDKNGNLVNNDAEGYRVAKQRKTSTEQTKYDKLILQDLSSRVSLIENTLREEDLVARVLELERSLEIQTKQIESLLVE
jgi:hypothetical protein